jgi:hypothetical protein
MLRRNALRIVYALGLTTYTVYVYWYVTVYVPAFAHISGMNMSMFIPTVPWVFATPPYLIVAAPLAALIVRPMWWGKLMMLLFLLGAPMSWLLSSFGPAIEPRLGPLFRSAATFGYVLAALAIVQQIIDPTIWRPPSTWLSKDCPPPWPFGRKSSRRAPG